MFGKVEIFHTVLKITIKDNKGQSRTHDLRLAGSKNSPLLRHGALIFFNLN